MCLSVVVKELSINTCFLKGFVKNEEIRIFYCCSRDMVMLGTHLCLWYVNRIIRFKNLEGIIKFKLVNTLDVSFKII